MSDDKALSKEGRQRCWDAHDFYWCLDNNSEDPRNLSMRENHLRDNAVKSGYIHCKSKTFGHTKYYCNHSKIAGKYGHTVQKCHQKCNLTGKGCRI